MATFRPLPAPLDRPIRIAALISGGGTTVLNLQKKIEAGELQAEIVLVVASRGDCAGIVRARDAGLAVEVVERKQFEAVSDFSAAVFSTIDRSRADLVTLAGFLSLLEIPEAYRGRVMNVHPSLIPAFCGKGYHGRHVHAAVLERGAKVSGCTVHFADNEYDHGPIIVQRTVPVLEDDTVESLAGRVFGAECEAYPEAIKAFALGKLDVDGRRVRIR
ncbi:MAG: phosphoribosylglycinamide formyltransferase [Planctomycetota bacterium]|nr:phosphoribosylglycinamide formyltransferase [Planctomycetaceae bacterium]MDQ3333263.1 phosphoribosylglycinamide formyltransferase [Planctomycetota bacterium]